MANRLRDKMHDLSSTMVPSTSNHIREELGREVEELTRIVKEVQDQVDQVKDAKKGISEEVNKWLEEAHTVSTSFITLLVGERFKLTLMNRLVPHKRQSKKYEQEILEMKAGVMNLVNQGKNILCNHFPGDAIGIELVWRGGFVNFKSRIDAFDTIMRGLEDPTVGMIGISGMGGIGKTKLVVEIGKRAKDKKMFNHVVMATVSQNPNIRNIQGTFADMLGMELKAITEDDRENELLARFELEKKVLVILDDVWEEIEMKSIGVPLSLNHEGFKIILTTRHAKVCKDMSCDYVIALNVIEDTEAWALFSDYAELQGKTYQHGRAKKIVKECSGLPLAIVTVGSCLRGRSSQDYEDALRKLANSNFVDVESADKEIYSCLKLSYDYLEDEETKLCFLLCSLYPQDSVIKVELLTRFVFGLGLFQKADSIAEVRDKVSAAVKKLENVCLLSPVVQNEDDLHNGVYFLEQHCVKIHDMIRDVALWIIKVNGAPFFMPTSFAKMQKYIYENGAVFHVDPNLEIMIVKQPKDETIPLDTVLSDDFSEGIASQALDIQSLKDEVSLLNFMGNFHNLRTFGLLIAFSESLTSALGNIYSQARWQQYKVGYNMPLLGSDYLNSFGRTPNKLPSSVDLSAIGKFKNLAVLHLRGSDGKLPESIGELCNLRLLDLSQWFWLETIPSKVLSRLTKLEELYTSYATNSCSDVVTLYDLNSLHFLTSFTGKFRSSLCIPSDFRFDKLQRYTIMFNPESRSPRWEFPTRSRNLRLNDLDGITISRVFGLLFPAVEYVCISTQLEHFQNIAQINGTEFKSLKELIMKHSDIKCHIGAMEQQWPCLENIVPDIIPIGPQLERLDIIDFEEIKYMYDLEELALLQTQHQLALLPRPKFLKLEHLSKLQDIWKWSGLQTLDKQELLDNDKVELCILLASLDSLVHLCICHSNELEHVFYLPQLNNQTYKGQLSNLTLLELENLPRLKCIWRGHQQYYCLRNLTNIHLRSCNQLTSLFTSTIARGLVNLQNLKIKGCEALETLILHDDQDEAFMDHYSCISQNSFSEIKIIDIQSCGKLKSVLPISFVSQGLLKLENIVLKDCAELEHVFGDYGEEIGAQSGEIMLNNLQNITLVNLPKLVSFLPLNCRVKVPSLPFLKVDKSAFTPRTSAQTTYEKEQNILRPLQKEICNKFERMVLKGQLDVFHVQMENYNAKKDSRVNQHVAEKMEGSSLHTLVKRKQNTSPSPDDVWTGGSDYSSKIHHMEVDCIPTMKCLFTRTMSESLESLEVIEILNCKELDHIFEPSDELTGLKTRYSATRLPNLTKINIQECDELKSVFPLSMAQQLPRLEEVFIKRASKLEYLFNEDCYTGQNNKDIMLPNLNIIQLDLVPSLSVICPPNYSLKGHFAELYGVFIENCNLEAIFDMSKELVAPIHEHTLLNLEELCLSCLSYLCTTDRQLVNLSHLRVLKVNNCCALSVSLFTITLARALKFLETIELIDCKLLRNVIEPAALHHELESNLPGKCFPQLTNLLIEGCDRIKVIFPLSVAHCLPELRWICIQGAQDLEHIFMEDRVNENVICKYVELPELSYLYLKDLPSLRKICPQGYALICDPSLKLQKEKCPSLNTLRDFPYRNELTPTRFWKMRHSGIICYMIFLYGAYLQQDILKTDHISIELFFVYLALLFLLHC